MSKKRELREGRLRVRESRISRDFWWPYRKHEAPTRVLSRLKGGDCLYIEDEALGLKGEYIVGCDPAARGADQTIVVFKRT